MCEQLKIHDLGHHGHRFKSMRFTQIKLYEERLGWRVEENGAIFTRVPIKSMLIHP